MNVFLVDPWLLKWQEEMWLASWDALNVLSCWWGMFVFQVAFFPLLKLEQSNWNYFSWSCSRLEKPSHLGGVTKVVSWWLQPQTLCYCDSTVLLSAVPSDAAAQRCVLGGCIRWDALLCGQVHWLRSALNAISFGISVLPSSCSPSVVMVKLLNAYWMSMMRTSEWKVRFSLPLEIHEWKDSSNSPAKVQGRGLVHFWFCSNLIAHP